ncbi:transmembrane protein, putative [Entamoeba dispar SAW760]|uniref:Transmembrane protein, putative n=1 Tax=Entamoeba dispar (strain ATCC PRA-260 / SAW760) TaxID=370354 RepID=B0ER52_ENTDS|nr:uncharacterized protein EDI_326270 [Entamoeba dispar SAW760]EDR23005.1 transmembrane protein, putative [Entamoeba dispar SAW760]|eukprot:EDR23005.1 transmembrane protein, putative [Entamoeba dispar SAW760]
MSGVQPTEIEMQLNDNQPQPTQKNQVNVLDPNELMKPLLASISPIGLCLIYLGFLALVGISLGLSSIAPSMYIQESIGTWQCNNSTITSFDANNCTGQNLMNNAQVKGPLGIYKIGPFSILNREFTLNGKFKNNLKYGYFKKQIFAEVGIYTPSKDNGDNPLIVEEKTREFIVECLSGEDYCNSLPIYEESFTNNSEYLISIQFISSKFNETDVGEFVLELSAISSHYTLFELCWKFVFIFYSCIIVGIYLFIFRTFIFKTWIFEVKWTFILLIILVIQNNPIYSYQYTLDTFIPELINVTVYSLFYVFLLFYVLITFEFYRYGKGTKQIKYWIPRIIFFLFFFAAVELVFVYNKSVGLSDPYYNPLKDITSLVMAVIALIFVIAYIFWLIYILIRSFSDGIKLGKTKRKLRLFGGLTMISMMIFFMMLALSFFFGNQQTLSISLTTTAFVNFFCTLLVVINIPHQGEESAIWSEERSKVIAVDDLLVYKQLPDDVVSELSYDGNDDKHFSDLEHQQQNRSNHSNEAVLYDGSEAIEL